MRDNPNREKILAALGANDVVSGEEISAQLGVTRAAVWKQITSLRASRPPSPSRSPPCKPLTFLLYCFYQYLGRKRP